MTVDEISALTSIAGNLIVAVILFVRAVKHTLEQPTEGVRTGRRFFWQMILAGVFWGSLAYVGLVPAYRYAIGDIFNHYGLYTVICSGLVNILSGILIAWTGERILRRANSGRQTNIR